MSSDVESSARLEELGYSQDLRRRLKVWHVVGLSLADVSPTMAVLLLTAGVFAIGGTFAIGANLLVAFAVLMIALCLAELGSMYPVAGGMYTLVRRVLPAPFAWVTMFNYLLQGIVIPASIALGIGVFLKDLFPGLAVDDKIIALIALAIVSAVAVTRVEIGAWATVTMVVVELVVLTTVTVAALAHPHQNLVDVTFHPTLASGATLSAVTFGVMLATLAPAFNVINGYDSTLGFSEELIGGHNKIARAVILSAILASLFILVPLIAAVVAAPDLKAFFADPAPVVYSVRESLGSGASKIVDIGVIVALMNANLALIMYFGRGVYTTGRDRLWPAPVNARLASLNRFKVPAWGVAALVVPAAVLVFWSKLNWLIIFAGTIIAAVYFCIGLAAIWARITQSDVPRPYRLPLWPVPPVIVVAFTGLALVKQETQYLIGEVVLIAAALGLWLLSRLWAPRDLERSDERLAEPVPARAVAK
jgi:amino acid transporter